MMRPSHRTQPYRKGGVRPPGPTLISMLQGRTAFGYHPMDQQRRVQRRRRIY